jgi:hypothetical protein
MDSHARQGSTGKLPMPLECRFQPTGPFLDQRAASHPAHTHMALRDGKTQ